MRIVLCSLCAAALGFGAGLRLGRTPLPPPAASREAVAAPVVSPTPSTGTTQPSAESEPAAGLDTGRISHALRTLASPADEERVSDELTRLARSDAPAALALAQQALTPLQRHRLTLAALKGWAAADAAAAVRWALQNVVAGERRTAVEAIAAGAIGSPSATIDAIRLACALDPRSAGDYGHALVRELTHIGRFDLAGDFAAGGPSEHRAYWLSTAFSAWAQLQPEQALAAAGGLAEAAVRADALQGIITGWSTADPARLVTSAEQFPPGELRAEAYRAGLAQWVSRDPATASTWMDRLEPSRDLDPGAAAVATLPDLVAHKPDVAVGWAESIVDPVLRHDTLLDLIRMWGATDPAAARRYALSTPTLPPELRSTALNALPPSL